MKKISKIINKIRSLWIFFKKKSTKDEEPWQIIASRYCVKNSEKGFTKKNLFEYIKSFSKVSDRHLEQFWGEEIYFPTGRKFAREHENSNWIPPLDLVSKVTDYQELKEARKNAKFAFIFSIMAIIISVATLWITLRLGENQIEVSNEQFGLQKAIWMNETMRNDRLEARDNNWRREDLEFQGRLPNY